MKRPIDNRELHKLKRFIEDNLGVTPRIKTVPLGEYHGMYYTDEDLILIDVNLERALYIHTLFHEAMHAYCFTNDIFKAYHRINEEDASPEELTAWFRTGIRAEMYVDAHATRLLKKYDPKLKVKVKTKKDWQDIFKAYRRELEEKRNGIV